MYNARGFFIIFSCIVVTLSCLGTYDLSVVGPFNICDGIGGLTVRTAVALNRKISVNCISMVRPNLDTHDALAFSSQAGRVALFTYLPFFDGKDQTGWVPAASFIKLAYSCLESTQIPKEMVQRFNNFFDAVIVPDAWNREVYKQSGVKVPIFVVPEIIRLDDFLSHKKQKKDKKTFVFGCANVVVPRKNYLKLITAFNEVFRGRSDVKLFINARAAESDEYCCIQSLLKRLKNNNIVFSVKPLLREAYIDFMTSLDCYISLSRGEGFAIPPREALAAGVPVILADNTAQTTVCQSGFVRSIRANLRVPATYGCFDNHNRVLGEAFDCTVEDVRHALLDVYEHYEKFHSLAQQAKNWVKQYTEQALVDSYVALARPKNVFFGSKDTITHGVITTSSEKLYKKYLKLVLRVSGGSITDEKHVEERLEDEKF